MNATAYHHVLSAVGKESGVQTTRNQKTPAPENAHADNMGQRRRSNVRMYAYSRLRFRVDGTVAATESTDADSAIPFGHSTIDATADESGGVCV